MVLVISRCKSDAAAVEATGQPQPVDQATSAKNGNGYFTAYFLHNNNTTRTDLLNFSYFLTDVITDRVFGPIAKVTLSKDGTGLGFSLEGGKNSPTGDQPLTIKKIFTGQFG